MRKAVLFDMDGVIYDSMPYHATAWHESMKRFGLSMAPSDTYKYEGMRGVETIKKLAWEQWGRQISDMEAQKMYDLKSELFSQCPPAKKMDGIVELMTQIKADGLTIGVVTGSGQHSLLNKLEEEFPGLLYKQFMVTSFDVRHGKPDPEPYLQGLRKTGATAEEAIVVENAPLGVRAARAAGIFTIAVNTGPLPDQKLWDEGANMVFSSMTQLSEQWKQLAEKPITRT